MMWCSSIKKVLLFYDKVGGYNV